MRIRVKSAACAVGLLLVAAEARAVSLRARSTAGLMQQPTSHYYHFIYGGNLEVATDKDGFIGHVSYIERPPFVQSGYIDQDRGLFGMIGTKLGKSPDAGLYPLFGFGRMAGYVKSDPAAAGITETEVRSFELNGLVVALEYRRRLGPVTFGAGHQSFVGYVDRSELQAFVAWPYNFYQLQLGVQF